MSSLSYFKNYAEDYQIGEIIAVAKNDTAPAGFLKCDGSILSQSVYPDLYNKIGLISSGNVITGNTWVAGLSGQAGADLYTAVYGNETNKLWVTSGEAGAIATSTDGIVWTARTTGTASILSELAYGNGFWVYGGLSGLVGVSTDGITWSQLYGPSGSLGAPLQPSTVTGMDFQNGVFFYGATNFLATSTQPTVSWITRTVPGTSTRQAVAYGGSGVYVCVGGAGEISTSTDTVTWSAVTSGTTSTLNSITYGKDKFVAVGGGGVILNSTKPDASEWTTVSTEANFTIYKVVYGDGLFVAVGDVSLTGKLITSTDGITWDARTSGTTSAIRGLGYGNGTWIYTTLAGSGQNEAAIGRAYSRTYDSTADFILPNPNMIEANSIYSVFSNVELDYYIKAE